MHIYNGNHIYRAFDYNWPKINREICIHFTYIIHKGCQSDGQKDRAREKCSGRDGKGDLRIFTQLSYCARVSMSRHQYRHFFFFVIIINGLNLFTILYVCDVCTCVSVRGFGSEGEVCDLCNLLRYFSTALCQFIAYSSFSHSLVQLAN